MSLSFPIQYRSLGVAFARWYRDGGGEGNTGVPLVEVLARIRGDNGEWSRLTTMQLDTGASVSLLPIDMAESLGLDDGDWLEHDFFGVAQREECKVPAKIARVVGRLQDESGQVSPEFSIVVAFTAAKPLVPLLGMKDSLERFAINMDFKAAKVVLEWSE